MIVVAVILVLMDTNISRPSELAVSIGISEFGMASEAAVDDPSDSASEEDAEKCEDGDEIDGFEAIFREVGCGVVSGCWRC